MPHKTGVPMILRPVPVVIAILAIGPFALPLVWASPSFTRAQKLAITVLMVLLSIWLFRASHRLYSLLSGRIQELQGTLNP